MAFVTECKYDKKISKEKINNKKKKRINSGSSSGASKLLILGTLVL